MAVTADQFLESLKRRVTVPANDELLKDRGLLEIGDDVIRDKMAPLMLSVNENYFVQTMMIPLVLDQTHYDIPYRALGRTLRDIKRVSNQDASSVADMSQVALEDAHLFGLKGLPSMFYFEGDQIVLVPAPVTDDYSLKVWYDLQPGLLVVASDAAKVLSVTGDVVTVEGSIPSSWAAGTVVDFIRGKSGCRTLAIDVEVINVDLANSKLTFGAGAVPEGLVKGDWISLQGTSPVLQLPDEAAPLAVTLAAMRVMHALGDFEAEQRLEDAAREQETSLLKMIAPRIAGEQKKIVNRSGLLRGQGRGRFLGRRGWIY